jgi:hypothetical protein
MGLHHAKGQYETGDKPVNLGALLYNIGKIPEMVLGLHRDPATGFTVTVPKNRGGKSGMALPLGVDYNTARVGGFANAA